MICTLSAGVDGDLILSLVFTNVNMIIIYFFYVCHLKYESETCTCRGLALPATGKPADIMHG